MAALRVCSRFATSARWKCHVALVILCSPRSRSLSSGVPDPGGSHRKTQTQFWNTLVSNSTASSGTILEQRNRQHLDTPEMEIESLLKACAQRKDLWEAKRVLANVDKLGVGITRSLGECLVSTLVKCGGLGDALQVFHRLPQRTVFSWTAIISGYTMAGQACEALRMYDWMRETGVQPNTYTFVSLLKACGFARDIEQGKRIHGEALKYRCATDLFVRTSLIDMYGKCGSILDARNVFDGVLQCDLVTWNAMIAAYAQQGEAEKALELYQRMWEKGLSPNARTFVSSLQACGMLAEKADAVSNKVKCRKMGEAIHADARRRGYDSEIFVGNTLVSMYAKCGSLVHAQKVFDGLSNKDVVSWNAMLGAHNEHGQAEDALKLYKQMVDEGKCQNARTLVSALQACAMLAEKEDSVIVGGHHIKVESLERGKRIHDDARKHGYDSDIFVRSTLISMFGKCGSIVDAQDLFDSLSLPAAASWNALMRAYMQQGQGGKALQLYEQMLERGVSPDGWTFVSIFKSCGMLAEKEEGVVVHGHPAKSASLEQGKARHADAWMKGCDTDVFVGNSLISMYGRCGSVEDAQTVFGVLSSRNVVSWTALIVAYVEHGQAEKALQVYQQMWEDDLSPDRLTFVTVLQACGMLAEKEEQGLLDGQGTKLRFLNEGKVIHGEAWLKGCDSDVFVSNTLISMYGKCGSILDAQNVFDGLSDYDTVSWNVMLVAYMLQGQAEKALQLYEQLREGVSPDVQTFVGAIQACGMVAETEVSTIVEGVPTRVRYLGKGKVIHADAWKKGHDTDIFLGNSLVTFYEKCGSRTDAELVFNNLSSRDVVSWTTLLMGAVEQGQAEQALHLYEQMQEEGLSPDARTFVCVVQACGMLAENEEETCINGHQVKAKSIEKGRAIHVHTLQKGYESDAFVATTLISMYGKCGGSADAENVFLGLGGMSVVAWTAMITVCALQGQEEKAFRLYEQMQDEGFSPDVWTFVAMLQACCILAEKEDNMDAWDSMKFSQTAKVIHADAWKRGFDSEAFVGSNLISVYGSSGNLVDACSVFDGLPHRNVVTWTAILTAHAKQDHNAKAVELFEQMHEEGVSPDARILVSVLQACGMLAEKEEDVILDGQYTKVNALQKGKAIHADVQRLGYDSDVLIGSTLISMYGKCGSILDAQNVFNGLTQRGVVAWTGLLAAYVLHNQGEHAIQLYKQMQEEDVTPDEITLMCVLQACSNTGSHDLCKHIHHTYITTENHFSPRLANSLIHAYGKCASMVDAETVFRTLRQPDIVSWNALIAGYAGQGNCAAGIGRYEEMQLAGIKPDGVTFLSLIAACSHAGLVEEGVEYFSSMSRDHGITPQIEHYASMVDLIGRAGYLTMLEAMLSNMPMQPDLAMWLCLLGACRKHGNVVLGKQAFDCIVHLQPKHTAAYVLMSNIYADAGLWDHAKEVNVLESKAGAWKKPFGKSWIEHEQEVHSFVVGDCNHHQQERIDDVLHQVGLKLEKHAGLCI